MHELLKRRGIAGMMIGQSVDLALDDRQIKQLRQVMTQYNTRTELPGRYASQSIPGGIRVSFVEPVTMLDSESWAVGHAKPAPPADAKVLRRLITKLNLTAQACGRQYRFRLIDGQIVKAARNLRMVMHRETQYVSAVQQIRAIAVDGVRRLEGVSIQDVRRAQLNLRQHVRMRVQVLNDGSIRVRRTR
jgi:hypothetical protein